MSVVSSRVLESRFWCRQYVECERGGVSCRVEELLHLGRLVPCIEGASVSESAQRGTREVVLTEEGEARPELGERVEQGREFAPEVSGVHRRPGCLHLRELERQHARRGQPAVLHGRKRVSGNIGGRRARKRTPISGSRYS